MKRIKSSKSIDLGEYSPQNHNPRAMYSLPESIQFCKSCTLSNQRPNSANEFSNNDKTKKISTIINDDGICDACRYMDIKNRIDWDDRERELIDLCDKYRRKDGYYDCLVPGSGGKDSVFISHILKNKYGMNPLTMTFAPHIYTEWGWKNMQSWIASGVDNYLFTPSFGIGYYDDGSGKKLGNEIQFRTTLEFSYELENKNRIAISFGHISNANLGDKNPGVEILSLNYQIPY